MLILPLKRVVRPVILVVLENSFAVIFVELWSCGPKNTARHYMHVIGEAQMFDRGVVFVDVHKNSFAVIFVELWTCGAQIYS